MDTQQKTLVTFGFIREFCKHKNMKLLPNDIITFFVSWLFFCDQFDAKLSHPALNLEILDCEYQ